jgi:hypothetical protein
MNKLILEAHNNLAKHKLYNKLDNLESLKIFMKFHVFAVWDFMSLLKSLQKEITCVSLPWNESDYEPELVQLINEIVMGEESDVDQDGNPGSHFSLYLRAMDEIGADTSLIKTFLETKDFSILPEEIQQTLTYHLNLAFNGKVHEVASSFFYGREKLIPDMFTSMVEVLEDSGLNCPTLIYYFKRHIEVDGGEHGPKALKCLSKLTETQESRDEALNVALGSLVQREKLWNFIHDEISPQIEEPTSSVKISN